MRIEVIGHLGDGRTVVFRVPDGGEAAGRWMADSAPSSETDVELDIPTAVDWRHIRAVEPGAWRHSVESDENGIWVTGSIQDVADGTLALDVGGSIVLVETTGEPPTRTTGLTVQFPVSEINLFPTNI